MARRISEPVGYKMSETKPKVKAKSEKPKKLSKAAEWWLANPKGIEVTYVDMKALMR